MAIETAQADIAAPGRIIVRVQHEGIVTRDAERSRDFYQRLLGLEVLPRPTLSSHGYWLGAAGGGFPQFHIIQSEAAVPGPEAPINPRARHTCFEVVDYDALKARMAGLGIPSVENEQPGGRVQLLCNDPDGNTLEFQRVTAA